MAAPKCSITGRRWYDPMNKRDLSSEELDDLMYWDDVLALAQEAYLE